MSVGKRGIAISSSVCAAAVVVAALQFAPTWTFIDPSVKARKASVSAVTLICDIAPKSHSSQLTLAAPGAPASDVRVATYPGTILPRLANVGRPSFPISPRAKFVVIRAGGDAADTVQALIATRDVSRLSRGVASQVCVPANAQWWFVGAAGTLGRDDLLVLSNPEKAPVTANIELHTEQGASTPAKAQGVVVPAQGQRILRVNDLAPGRVAVGIHVSTTGGAVHAGVLVRQSRGRAPVGIEWLPPAAPGATVVPFVNDTPGLPLVVSTVDATATVSIKAMSGGGLFQPAGVSAFTLPAGKARVIKVPDVTANASALLVQSTAPVVVGYVRGVFIRKPLRIHDLVAAAGQLPSRRAQTVVLGSWPKRRTAVLAAGPDAPAAGTLIARTARKTVRIAYSLPAGASRRFQIPDDVWNASIQAMPADGSGPYALSVSTRAVNGAAIDAAGAAASVRSTSVVLRAVVQVP